MKIYIAWNSDIKGPLYDAALSDKPEELRRISHNIEAANRIWESWILTIGGEVIASEGRQGQATVPADRMDELPELRHRAAEAAEVPTSIGVGVKLSEALIALQAAENRGGDCVVLYTDDVAREAEEAEDEHHLLNQQGGVPISKADFASHFNASKPSAGEATKVQNGSVATSPWPGSPSATPSPAGGPPMVVAPGGQPAQSSDLKQSVAAVLKQAQQMMPMLEKMKGENPELYDVINGSIQAMVEMARALFGQQNVQKGEVKAHHHLMLPPGSVKDGRVKVVHADGSTSWVSVRAGQILSEDNHAISSRNPEGR